MTRDDFFTFAKANGWVPGTPLTDLQKATLMTALKTRLVQFELAATHVVLDGTAPAMTADNAARALIEELH